MALSWNDVENEAGYRIIRDDGDNVVTQIDTVSTGTTAYVDSTVSPETSYDYVVEAFNDTGAGVSNTVNVETESKPATAHITLTVSTYKIKGVNHADLTVSEVSSYDVLINDDPNPINSNAVTEGYYTDNTGQKGGMSRSYKACDYDDDNDVCSDVVTVTW